MVRQKDGVASMVDASVERSGASEWYGVSREQESDARFLNVSAAQQAAILALRGVLQGGEIHWGVDCSFHMYVAPFVYRALSDNS